MTFFCHEYLHRQKFIPGSCRFIPHTIPIRFFKLTLRVTLSIINRKTRARHLKKIQGVSKKCTHTSNDEKSFIYEHTVKWNSFKYRRQI